jgi:hypothetical protein
MALRIAPWLIALFLMTGAALAADKRVALVIGNSNYLHTPKLDNPANDAADMAAALRGLGFAVIEGRDLAKAEMDEQIHAFARRLSGADVGVFFYAGHGLQVDGRNYLAPIDAKLSTELALDFEMVRLDLVQRTMERETDSSVIFLDACRDNPLVRNLARSMGTRSASIGRGLAAVETGVGTLISFSTQPGNVAADGAGRNSPFAKSLVRRIRTPGEDISSILIGVRNDVMAETNDRQIPWEHTALRSKLYFAAPTVGDSGMRAMPPAEAGGPFDGVWDVSITGGRYCPIKRATYKIRIAKGMVYARYKKRGEVSEAGDIGYEMPSKINASVTVRFTGKLVQDGGSGRYVAIGKKCAGTMVLKRSNSDSMANTQ